jgi:hypothetical protein
VQARITMSLMNASDASASPQAHPAKPILSAKSVTQ